MKKIFTLCVLMALVCVKGMGQVTVSGSTGANSTYTTLSAAFTAIGTSQSGNNIVISITANTTEPAAGAILGAGTWTTLKITPTGIRTITGAATAGLPLIDLSGADNVTIDGLNSGGNSLTISNTTVSATSNTSTIRFIGDATNNTITNCSVLGSSTTAVGTNGGNIFFGAGAVSIGNDNNTISNCNVGPAGTNLPSKGIYFSGSSNTDPGTANSGILINNNNIYDFFSATVTSAGIYVTSGTTNISITNNRFYETATRTQTTGTQHSDIWITNTSGNNYQITGNTIGYNSSSSTGTYAFVGTTSSVFIPIYLNVGTTTSSVCSSNTIAGIAMSGSVSGTSSGSPFSCIYTLAGLTTCNSNIIGSQTATGSITYTSSSTSASDCNAIFNFGSNNWITNNNTIGGFTIANSSTAASSFYGLRCNTGSSVTWTCTGNTIGGTVANSIQSTSTSTATIVNGILNSNPIGTITGNIVQNLRAAAGTGSAASTSVAGIVSASLATTAHNISQNTINTLSTGGTTVAGIVVTLGTANNIFKNKIYDISTSNTGNCTAYGMNITGGNTNTIYNNLIGDIRITAGVNTNATPLAAINLASGTTTNNVYYNTAYIGATTTTGSLLYTSALFTSTTPTTTLRNNILVNLSTPVGSGAIAAAYYRSSTILTSYSSTSNNNLFYAGIPSTGHAIYFDISNSDLTLAAYKTRVSARDGLSITENPPFLSTTGSSSDFLHINTTTATQIESGGAAISGYTTDFDGDTRNASTPDIGADEFAGTALDATAPAISYTALATICPGTNSILTATITDASGVPTSGSGLPVLYYKIGSGSYAAVTGVSIGSNQYTFSFGSGAASGDIVSYYIVAQDNAATPNVGAFPATGASGFTPNPPAASTPPTSPSTVTAAYILSGTYTVGTGGAFATLTAAVAAYNNACNITGPVVFSLINGSSTPYSTINGETFPITINASTYASTTNTLTIKPATGVNPVITGSSTTTIINLNGAAYVIIDGSNTVNGITQDLTISNTSTSGSTIRYINGASNNKVLNAVINGIPNSTAAIGIVYFSTASATSGNNSNTVSNNIIAPPSTTLNYYGVYNLGSSTALQNTNNIITNNSIYNFSFAGIFDNGYSSGFTYSGNRIYGTVTTQTSSTALYGIRLNAITIYTTTINANRIYDLKTTYTSTTLGYLVGVDIFDIATTSTCLVYNNMISLYGNGTTAPGLRIVGIADECDATTNIYYNSVNIYGAATSSNASYGFLKNYTSATILQNNIFSNTRTSTGTGKQYAIGWTASGTLNSNYNDLYSSGNTLNVLGSYNSLDNSTLAAWQTASSKDANSKNVLPSFTSATDLHLTISGNAALSNTATPIAGITTDFDNEARSATTPDIGADEFVACTPPTATASSNTPVCTGTTNVIQLTGTSTIAGSTFAWTGPNSFTSTQQNPQITGITAANAGTYSLVATASSCPSDPIATTVVVNTTPNVVTITPASSTICNGSSVSLTASGGTLGSTGNATLGTATTLTTATTQPTAFCNRWAQYWNQTIYTAAELTAAGLTANSKIASITYTTTTQGDAPNNTNFSISIGNTTSTTLSAFQTTGLSIVYGPLTYTHVVGANTITFTTPYTWDGTSNIIIDVRHDGVDASNNAITYYTAASDNKNIEAHTSTTSATTTLQSLVASASVTPTPSTARLNIILGFTGLNPVWAWTPSTGLNTTTSATVVASPTVNTTYTATATINGCSNSNTVAVSLSTLAVTATTASATCNGTANGSIAATGTGGTAPYTYSTDGVTFTNTTGNFTGLAAGNYMVTVKDASATSCTSTVSVTITQPTAVTISEPAHTDPTCNNGTNGSITVGGAGGTAPYTYTVDGGTSQPSGVFNGLASGSHTFVVTDANGCTATNSYSLTNPAPIVVTAGNSGDVCAGGTISFTATGGTSYVWTGPNGFTSSLQNPSITNAQTTASGTYIVTVTDANGCSNTASTSVVVNATIPVSVSLAASQNPVCSGTLVTFTATPTNGGTTPSYQFFVNSALQTSTGSTFSYTPANGDVVSVTLTSSVNCASGPATDQVTMSVTASVPVTVSLAASQNPVCSGTSVTYTATGTGGGTTPIYNFLVNNVSQQSGSLNTYTYTPANNDQVKVVLTSNSTCATGNPATSNVTTMTVNPTPAAPIVTAGGPTTFCSGGSVTLTSSYTTGNTWSNGATSQSITVSASGNYSVTYFSGNCTSPASAVTAVTVNSTPAAPTVTTSGATTFCSGGSVTLTSSYATGNTWSNGATTQSITVSASGNYSVTYSDGTCSSTSAVTTVTVNAVPTVTASTNCSTTFGSSVTLTATATTGSGSITTYQWVLNGATNVGTNSATYTTSVAGSYTVIVTNSNGCSTTSNAVVITAGTGPLAAGTYTISGTGTGCNNFTSIAAAATYLNTNGIAGPVTFTLTTGAETAPPTGIVLGSATLNASLSATNTLKFVRSGAGTYTINAGVGTATPASAAPDGILSIQGADYITIDGLTFTDGNTTNPATMEFGVAMFKASATDGVNNNIIQNCTFNMQRVNNATGTAPLADGSVAIAIYNSTATAATTALTPTVTSGANSNNKIYSNTINSGNTGIIAYGYNTTTSPYNYTDQGNDIGGASATTGNTILNFGGGGITSGAVGIRTFGQYGLNASYNTINNNNGSGISHASTLRGIYLQTATGASETVNNNTITLTSAGTSSQMTGIDNVAGGVVNSNTVAINNNTIVTNYATATTGVSYGISNTGSPTTLNINSNTVTVNSSATSGSNYLVYQVGSPVTTQTINGNTVGFTFSSVTSAVVRAIYYYGGASTCATSVSNNAFNSFTFSNTAATAGSGEISGIYLGSGAPLNLTISGNNFNNLNAKTTGQISLIYNSYTMPAGGTRTVQNNAIVTGFARTGTASTSGLYCYYDGFGSSPSGTTTTFSGNSFNNITANTTGSFYGFYSADYSLSSTSAPVKNFYNNTFNNLNTNSSTVYLGYLSGYMGASSMHDNTATGLLSASTGTIYGWYASSGLNMELYNNTVSNATLTGTASLYSIYYAGSGTGNVYNNTVTNITRSGAGTTYGIYNVGTTSNVYNNTVTNITNTAAGTTYGIYTSGTTASISKNFVNTLSSLGSVYGIYVSTGTTVNVFQHGVIGSNNYSIYGLTSSGAATVANGITVAGGTTVNVYQNNIYNLSNSSSSTTATSSLVNGMSFTGGTTVSAYNNLIGNLTAPAVSYVDAIRGISVTSTTASSSYNLYYNTIYLNASSTGATFGTTGIYHTTSATATTAKLDLRNNIVVNLSTPGTSGITTALRRSSTTLTNYATTSNNNLFYAGAPSGTQTILYDGTNAYSSFPAFQTAVAARETASFTGETGFTYSTPGSFFQSLTGSDATFLHLVNGITTQAESGGQVIASIPTDYDGETRPNNTTSNKPDVGADEFVGVTPAPNLTLNSFYLTGTTTPGTTAQCIATGRDVSVTVTTPIGTISSVILNYSFNGTAQTPITMTVGTGGVYTATIPAATPVNASVTWTVVATNTAGISTTYTGNSYSDAPLTGITITASASRVAVCADNTTSVLTATVSSGTNPAYTTPSVTSATTDEDLGNVTITSGATTLFNNTSARNSLTGSIGTATGTAGGYSNFTAFGPYSLTAGQTYNFSLSSLDAGTGFSHYMYIFIDYNRDGVFTGSNETVYTSPYVSGAHTVTGSFTVPSSVSIGSARMRVVVSETALTGSSTSTAYGEFEDYAISLAPVFTYTWSNGATTVGTGSPLTVNPTATTNYTVTATDASGCFITSVPVTVTVNPTPTAPTTTNSIQCGPGVPTASIADPNGYTTPTFTWYSAATGGTVLQSSTSNTYTTSINATTTFYVSVKNPTTTCESGRTAITVTVNTPDAITASATPATLCIGASTTLSVAQTGTTNNYVYTWTVTSSNASTSGISGSVTGSSVVVTPTAAGTYTYQVSGYDAATQCTATSTVSVTVSALPTTPTITASSTKVCAGTAVTLTASGSTTPYCTPTYTTTQASGDYIGNVTFAGINNNTGDAANDYTYYSSLNANVTGGTLYPISLTAGGTSSTFYQNFGVWIDYNQNGTFETSEFVFSTSTPTFSPTPSTGNITIPTTAYNGVTRMRIVSRYGSTTVTSSQACSISTGFGEAEDYNITITGGITNPNAVIYTWSNGATGSSITVNPTTTTDYTVTATNAGGCFATSATTTVTVAAPLAGIYSVGSGSVAGETGHYATLTAAVADYNTLCTNGAVTFALTDASYSTATGETFPIVINANSNASATNTLTIKPADGIASVAISGAVNSGALIKLNGADYVIIDGSNTVAGTTRNLTISNTSTTSPTAIALTSLGTGAGATNNTVKNVIISNGTNASGSYGIFAGGATIGSTGADNDFLTIQNDSVAKVYNGIVVYGTAAASAGGNDGLVITGNKVGASTATGYVTNLGIGLQGSISPVVSVNEVFNIITSGSISPAGLDMGANVVSASVYNNKIHDIQGNSTGGYGAYGINISSATGTSGITIYNNFIYGVKTYGVGFASTTFDPFGIRIVGGTNHKIYYNSINMTGSFTTATSGDISAGIIITSSAVTGLDIRNNSFSNSITGTSSKAYSVYAASGTIFGTINYNDYYSNGTGATAGFLSYLGSDITTLAAWQTATTQDVNSLNVNPQYTSATNLHLQNGSALDGKATPISGITTDIDGDARDASTPDIGADEFTPIPYDAGITTLVGPYCAGTDNIVVHLKNFGTAPITSVTINWSVNGTAQTPYSWTGTLAPSDSTNVTIGTYTIAANTAYTITASTSLPNGTVDLITANDSYTGTFQSGLSGIYTVGTGGDFTTITAAVTAATSYGLCGPTTFSLTQGTYSTGETFPITINALTGASSTNTLTIKPAIGVTSTITGSNTSAIIKLNGADYVTIDGSNTGGTDRSLTVKNTSTGTSSTDIWVANTTAGDGATNNTIKNTIIAGSGSTGTLSGIISSGSTVTSDATIANANNTYQNDSVVAVYYGITVLGPTATEAGTVITGNSIGSPITANQVGNTGIWVEDQQNVTITNNTINGVVGDNYSDFSVGIYVSGAITGGVVSNNKINNISNTDFDAYPAHGISLYSTTASTGLTVANNFISNVIGYGDDFSAFYNGYGIAAGTGGGYNVYYNTISMAANQTTTDAYSGDIYIASVVTGLNIVDNILSNTQTSDYAYGIYSAAANTAFTTIDYNDYYAPVSGKLGYVGSTDRRDIAAIQTGFGGNTHSLTIQPFFVSATDLHLTGCNSDLDGKGTAVAGITTDIDGQSRQTLPDMGADEFTSVTSLVAITSNPATAVCEGTPVTLTESGGTATSWLWSTGATTQSITVTPTETTTYTVTAITANCSKTEQAIVTVNPLPTAATITPANSTICEGTIQQLTATATSTGTLFSQNFNITTVGTVPANWVKGSSATTTSTWGAVASSLAGGTANELRFKYGGLSENLTSFLRSPVINASTWSSLEMTFNYMLDNYNAIDYPYSLKLQTSTDNTTWTDRWTMTPTTSADIAANTVTVDLSALSATSTVYFRFAVVGQNWGLDNWYIDNVTVTGTKAAPMLTWSPTTGLYTNSGATTPYTGGNAATVYAKPSTTTTYTVTSSDGTCTNTATTTVTVNPAPTAAFGSPTFEACYGTSATIALSGTPNSTVTYNIDGGTPATAAIGIGGTGSIITSSTLGSATTTATHTITITSTTSATGCTTTYSSNPPQTVLTVDATPTLSLTSASSTTNQTVCRNNAINAIGYTFGGSATGVTVTNLPAGLDTLTTGNTFTISGTPTTSGTYTVNTTGGTCTPVSLSGTVTVSPFITWTGAISTNWSLAGNWCSNSIPTATDDVVIPVSVPRYPQLTAATTTIGGLDIEANATVDLNSKDFITGAVTGTGMIIGTVPSNMTVTASGTLNFMPTSNTITNLNINGTAVVNLGSALNIKSGISHGIVTIANGATLNTDDHLTLKSDADGTAEVGSNTSNATYITGNVTVERYTDALKATGPVGTLSGLPRRAWRLITSPITGQTIHQAWQENAGQNLDPNHPFGTLITGEGLPSGDAGNRGFDYIGGGNHTSIRKYDSITNNWVILPTNGLEGTNIPLHSSQAYMVFVRGDRSVTSTSSAANLRASGILGQGAQSIIVTPGTTNYTLVGNPYAATIDFGNIYSHSAGAIANQFYTWNSHLGVYGSYVMVTSAGNGNYEATPAPFSTNSPVAGTNGFRYIQSGSAFFVSPSETPDSTHMNILETDKATGNTPPLSSFRELPSNMKELLVNLNLKDNDTSASLADGFRARFDNEFSPEVDNDDIIKANNFNENLGLARGGRNLIIEARSDVQKTDTLFLKMSNVTKRNYQLQMRADNFAKAPGIEAWLVDNYLGTKQPISLSGNVVGFDFAVTSDSLSWNSGRFMIVFQNNAVVLPITLTNVKAAPQNGGVNVSWTVTNEVNVKGYTIEKSNDGGQTYTAVGAQQPAHNNAGTALTSYNGFDAQPKLGDNLYRIRIEAKDGAVTYSTVVKVIIGSNGSGIEITVYPNPVRDGKVNMQMTNLEIGTYLVSVYASGSGQTVYQRKVVISLPNTTQSEQLILGKGIAQGSYQLRVSDHKGVIIKETQLVIGR